MYNYNKQFLEKAAAETGFLRDNLEKVFRLCEVLQFLNEENLFAENLALKGGTAINLTVFDLPRLSVDIDLDFTKTCNRDEMFGLRDKINDELLNYMFAQGYALSPHTKNPHTLDSWVFYFQNSGGNRDNIKVETNYSMRNHILPLVKRRVKIDFLQFDSEVSVLSPLELFGSKINALIARSTPRDLYDVNNMLQNNIFDTTEQALLRKIITFYLVVGADFSKIDFEYNKLKQINYPKIRAALIPLLRKTEKFDFEQAKTEVLSYLSDLMTFTDNENLFIEHFNKGIYQPELLFDDAEITERIKNHPMAVWKTKEGNSLKKGR
jgi:predicted nucleotidyltransferase component of viral defense system